MSDNQPFLPDMRRDQASCTEEQMRFLEGRQTDIKPMLKALAGLCLFFGAMAVIAAFGAVLVIALKNLHRLL
ncbi:MAG: hypothetical protein P4N60_11845 [Verrucomicrobiae bacterium]|nr:hypothetical protein [Verrucomicrobiae bacterium]